MVADQLTQVEFDLEEVQGLSLDLLRLLEDTGCTIGEGVAASALSIGRLMAPSVLDGDAEIKFVQNLLEWTSMYFVPGGIN